MKFNARKWGKIISKHLMVGICNALKIIKNHEANKNKKQDNVQKNSFYKMTICQFFENNNIFLIFYQNK